MCLLQQMRKINCRCSPNPYNVMKKSHFHHEPSYDDNAVLNHSIHDINVIVVSGCLCHPVLVKQEVVGLKNASISSTKESGFEKQPEVESKKDKKGTIRISGILFPIDFPCLLHRFSIKFLDYFEFDMDEIEIKNRATRSFFYCKK